MRRARLTIDVAVPDWATHVAVDGDGDIVFLSERRNNNNVQIGKDEETESWYAAKFSRQFPHVLNWRDTLTETVPAEGGEG